MRFTAKVISGGRVTIPDFVRESLQIKDDDIVEIEVRKVEEGKA